MKVHVVRTGTANLASVLAALRRLGHEPHLTTSAHDVAAADPLVLPGVGAFGAAMAALSDAGLVAPLQARFRQGLPSLCICLGLQLLASGSDESPGVAGLGLFEQQVQRFSGPVRIPQLGWNDVTPDPGCKLVADGAAYYANSYRLAAVPNGWTAAWTDHGGRFVGALEQERVLACQFHPELSGRWGLDLLGRWLAC